MLTDKQKGVILSALKDLGRNVLIVTIPLAIDRLLTLQLDPIILAGAIAILKYIDAYLHKYGKEYRDERLVTGITRF
jgi:hypothetical protein